MSHRNSQTFGKFIFKSLKNDCLSRWLAICSFRSNDSFMTLDISDNLVSNPSLVSNEPEEKWSQISKIKNQNSGFWFFCVCCVDKISLLPLSCFSPKLFLFVWIPFHSELQLFLCHSLYLNGFKERKDQRWVT